ncbi:uncharacterized protein LOC134436141 [Engraulis encrasicolus]|uniref:uncharacterized protein LOC134436141 n=1 Tax=Engraulis encrasicolus TaxID=184585 RepID=UPI002FD17D51
MQHCAVQVTLNLLLLIFAEQDVSAASSASHVLVQPDDNVTLSCNTSPGVSEVDTVTWIHQREDELKRVINLEYSKVLKTYYIITGQDSAGLTVEDKSWNLVITKVNDSDLGLYHCLVRRAKAFIAEKSIRLTFTEAGGELQGSSAVYWGLLACVGLASACLGALLTFGISHRLVLVKSATPNTGNSTNNDLKDVGVHYASVKCQGIKGWHQPHRQPDVTYATVARHGHAKGNATAC